MFSITWCCQPNWMGHRQKSDHQTDDRCQPNEPLASLVTTNRIINVYGFIVVIMLLMYSVLHCMYSVGNKITISTYSVGNKITTSTMMIVIFKYPAGWQ